LRLAPVVTRDLGSEAFTWAELLYGKLSSVRVFVLYFPSRFDLPVDTSVETALRAFGERSSTSTLVNFWDPTDPEFSRALGLFEVDAPPALVLAGGSPRRTTASAPLDPSDLYAISVSDAAVLGDPARLASAVNSAHEVLTRGDAREITGYLRKQAASSLLEALGRLGAGVRDQLIRFRPKFQLPGGISIQIG
jgi:hypothetical protein